MACCFAESAIAEAKAMMQNNIVLSEQLKSKVTSLAESMLEEYNEKSSPGKKRYKLTDYEVRFHIFSLDPEIVAKWSWEYKKESGLGFPQNFEILLMKSGELEIHKAR